MILKLEETKTREVVLPVPWVRFLLRLTKLSKGHRYTITLDIDKDTGPSWTVLDMGKIERGAKLTGETNEV